MASVNGDKVAKKPLFRDLGAQINLDEVETSEIESLCMRCHENVNEELRESYMLLLLAIHSSTGHLTYPADSSSNVS